MKSQNSACITLLVFLICSLLIFPVISFGQDTERDNTLKPYTSCHFDNGLRIIQIDSLPKNVKSRPIKTTTGNKKVSLADGYRIMVSYKNSSDWFANIKAEKSFAADYEQDKENVIENLKWTTSNEKGMESQDPIKVNFNGYEGYKINRQTLTGNILGVYVLFSDAEHTITTIYFINQNPKNKRFQRIEEWQTLRDEFLISYTGCINQNRKS